MKKLVFLAGFYCLHATGYAHFVPGRENITPMISKVYSNSPTGYIRALQHFRDTYPGIEHPVWTTLSDKGFLCMFHIPGIVRRIHYDKYGTWLFTVSGYEAGGLNEDIKADVLSKYPGYRIDYINEITSNAPPVYIINIEDPKNIKVVKVINDRIEVQQALEKAIPGSSYH